MNRKPRHNAFAPIRAAGLIALAVVAVVVAHAQVPPPFDPLSFRGPDPAKQFSAISIEQHLGAQVPLDMTFRDEEGREVQLGTLMGDKPAVLALVYYECPMLCNEVLNGVEIAVKAMGLAPGEDYNVLTVTIAPDETPGLAAKKKAAHMDRLAMPGAEDGWHFLSDLDGHANQLADIVGFGYVHDATTGQYAHAAGIMVLTPSGQVSKYYHGVEYIPRDLKFGLVEASEGRIGTLVDKLVMLCFQYDPTAGAYGFYVIGAMRIGAVLTLGGLVLFWALDYRQQRRKRIHASAMGTSETLENQAAPGHGIVK